MIIAGVAFVVMSVSWWLSGRLANRESSLFVLDHPNERSLHDQPTPRTGGVAILSGWLCGLVLARWAGFSLNGVDDSAWFGWSRSAWIVFLTYGVGIVSFLDDWRGVPVAIRLACHLFAALIVVVGMKLWISVLSLPLLGSVDLGWLAIPVSIGFLVWMSNLYNFMDGMDGFAGGMTVAGGGFLAWFGWSAGHGFMFVAAACAAAAAIGFLVYNFPPARIFMGDVGSVPLGFLLGALMLLGVRDRVVEVWASIMLFSPFIVDATVTLIRRAIQGERIWQAHRSHYYQRLVLLGWGHRRTVCVEYGFMALCGALAWGYQVADDRIRLVVLGCWGLLMGLAILGVHFAEQRVLPVQTKA